MSVIPCVGGFILIQESIVTLGLLVERSVHGPSFTRERGPGYLVNGSQSVYLN